MSPTDFFRELTFPLRSSSTMIAMITFYLLLGLISLAGFLGLWLAFVVLPALIRYLILIAAARARGIDADTPGIELFTLIGNLWTLFPVVLVILIAQGAMLLNESVGSGTAQLFATAMAFLFPAMIAVLVITQSPVESLNPVAIFRLVKHTGADYLYAVFLAIAVVFIPTQLGVLPEWLRALLELYLAFVFFAVCGSIIRAENLLEDVDLPDALEPDADQQLAGLEKERTGVLNHAYGFVSRGNREGGLLHLFTWLERDPDPSAAWRWFFEQMLRWEQPEPALFFAQHYLSRLLAQQDRIAAVKLLLRCRMINDAFRPKSEDIQEAIEAAEGTGNVELTTVLKRL